MNPELTECEENLGWFRRIAKKSPIKSRWFVLLILSLALLLNGEVWMTYETVFNQTQQYFNVEDNSIRNFFAIFLIAYSITAVPCVIFPQIAGYRMTLLIGCLFNCLGTVCRIVILPVVKLNKNFAYRLALAGHFFHGVAMAFVFSLPTLISSIWFENKETSLSTSIPFMANSFGVGLGYLDIFILMNNSHDPLKIMSSFRYIFIFEALVAFFTLFLCILFILMCPNHPNDTTQADRTSSYQQNTLWIVIKDTLIIVKKLFMIKVVHVGMLIFTLNCGNYNFIFLFLVEIVSYYSSNESSITGYIGAIGIILGGINTLIAGFIMKKTENKRIMEFAVVINLLSAISLVVIMMVISFSKFDNFAAGILFTILLSLCPIYITIGSEILANLSYPIDPNLSSSPAYILANIYGAVMPLLLSLIPISRRYILVMGYCLITYLVCAVLLSLIIRHKRRCGVL